MENFDITKTESGFHIDGFPDAAAIVALDGPKARRLADLSLHKSDLDFAADCLAAMNQVPPEPRVLRDALWRSAVIHYVKCFGDSAARFQLSATKIYQHELPQVLETFRFFRDLRNKHFVHDENSYAQSVPAAILNKPKKDYKIEKIVCISTIADIQNPQNCNNLKTLIDKAHGWVSAEADGLCDTLTAELEAEPYEKLVAREPARYQVPTVEDMRKKRR